MKDKAPKTWKKPNPEEIPVTMEVAAYRNAELPDPDQK